MGNSILSFIRRNNKSNNLKKMKKLIKERSDRNIFYYIIGGYTYFITVAICLC